jgi:uncharacterized repeat protein (TIGR01451 family)
MAHSEYTPTGRHIEFTRLEPRSSRRQVSARAYVAALLTSLATVLAYLASAVPASAGTTVASSFTKTGTDANNGASVTATGSTAKTSPGDTIDWVLHYGNSTGAPANVKITDPIDANEAFVKGSLMVPSGTGLSPQWSTNGGGAFAPNEPASGTNAIGASGLVAPTGLGSTSAFTPISTPTTGNGESGDGFQDFFYNGNVYNLHHHLYPGELSGTGQHLTLLSCHVVATGQECPGYGGGVYASSSPGSAFSTTLSTDNFTTMSSNWSALDQASGKLYFATTLAGTADYGVGCLDLSDNTSCGFTQLGTGPEVVTEAFRGWIVGGATVGSNYYLLDYTGHLDCFNISTGSTCGSYAAYGGSFGQSAFSGAQAVNWVGRNYVFTWTSSSGTENVPNISCVNVATGARCPGFPVSPAGDNGNTLLPVLNTSGEAAGVCAEWFTTPAVTATRTFACYDTEGKAMATPNPYASLPPGTAVSAWPNYAGTTLVVGTKMYYVAGTGKNQAVGETMSEQYQCFDWAAGTACAGFNSPVQTAAWASHTAGDLDAYTLMPDPYLPGCLAEDGDAGMVQYFDAATGALGCSGLGAQVAVNPANAYCDGTAHATAWSQIAISGISASQYTGAIYTVYDKEGNPVPGFKEVALAAGQSTIDISAIPMSGTTSSLSVVMTIANPSPGASAQLSLTFAGTSGAEVCFKMTVGAAKCSVDQSIVNQGDALTSGLNGVNDAPGGDDTGEAVFFLPANPTMSSCEADLSIEKKADSSKVAAGGQVMYTLVVQNHGPDTATGANVSDAIPAGLSIVSAQPTQGSCTATGAIGCSLGTILSGGSAQILVTANIASSASGKIENCADVSAFQTDRNPSNNSSCVGIEIAPPPPAKPQLVDIQVVKRVNHTVAGVGETLTYTLDVKNNGPGAAPDAAVTDTSLVALHVLSISRSQGTCTSGSPFSCKLGVLAAGKSATVTIKAIPRQTGTEVNSVTTTPGCTTSGDCPEDPNPNNNVSSAKTTVRPSLKLVKTVNHTVVKAGHDVTYHLTVTDPTPVAVKNVEVCDQLPSGLVFVGATPKAKLSNGKQCWSFKSLGAHKPKTIKLVAKALHGTSGYRTNHATASGQGVQTVKAHARVRVTPAAKRATPVTG